MLIIYAVSACCIGLDEMGQLYIEGVPAGECIVAVSEMKKDPVNGVPISYSIKDATGKKRVFHLEEGQTINRGERLHRER